MHAEHAGGGIGLATPLTRAIQARAARELAEHLGLVTVADLLDHLPRRYHRRGELTDLADVAPGEVVTVQARVARYSTRPMRDRRRMVANVLITDGRDQMSLVFFNVRQPWHSRRLPVGTVALFSGKADVYRGGLQLVNPEVQILAEDAGTTQGGEGIEVYAGALIPVYPATEKVSSAVIGRFVRTLLDVLGELPDPLPADLRRRHRLADLRSAYELVHRPTTFGDVERGRIRLKWDEALALQVVLAQRRRAVSMIATVARRPRADGILAAFDRQLPFPLTTGQREVGEAIEAELARPVPMHRLLQGEVGSGKTVVALRAMLAVVDAGGQAVLLAPTETLAVQHYRGVRALLGDLAQAGELGAPEQATRVVLLTSSLGARARREALAAAADGSAGLVIGTHALLHDNVVFRDLGLVVIDEQHRFGVEQRDALRTRASQPPHVLVMTATPIPRTVAMTVFGDLEVSTLTELPAGRQPVATHVVPGAAHPRWRDRIWGRIREEVAAGRQAFVVCPRISSTSADDGDGDGDGGSGGERGAAAGGQALAAPGEDGSLAGLGVEELAAWLADGPLAGLRVAMLHGRLPADEKDAVMTRFAAGQADVLVATTVIEVGVDVPNASVIAVIEADRFGVSQLHQLRGRVGRGRHPGWCLLHHEIVGETPATQRLANVASTNDGAELARLDLAQRREGDVLGVLQSGGRRSLRMLELLRDEPVILAAREEAGRLVAADPELSAHPELRRRISLLLDEDRVEYLEKG
ncbi:MAG: ATP-dependent DNA helicase RecG [Frankia sp.]|nr:ATP-dependent DNA helicase RecG [Frankia sp.]